MRLETDERGRLECPELFPPNTAFTAEKQEDGSVRVAPLAGEAPIVRLLRNADGFPMLPVQFTSEEIVAAVRAGRERE